MSDENLESEDAFPNSAESGFSMTDIYYLLLADLSDISDLVEKARSHANENQPRQSWKTFLKTNFLKDNVEDIQSSLKGDVMNAISKNILSLKPLGEPLLTAHGPLELRSKLIHRVMKDRDDIQQMTDQLSQLKASNKDLVRRSEELESIMSARSTSGEMKTQLKWQELMKSVDLHRAKLVKDIRYVTNHVCAPPSVPDILANVLKRSLTGNDPYFKVQDGPSDEDDPSSNSQILAVEFLLRCNLVTRHPHDKTLIRLSNIL